MKKTLKLTISLLLVLSLLLSYNTFILQADNSEIATNEMLDEVLSCSVVEIAININSDDLFINILSKQSSEFNNLIKTNNYLSLINERYQELIQVPNKNINILNQLMALEIIQRKYSNTNARLTNSPPQFVTVNTCLGNPVDATIYDETLEAWQLQDFAENAAPYQSAQMIRNPTANYNCHSYAWYSQSLSNIHWIDEPGAFLEDRTYIKFDGTINESISASVGDIIVYFNNNEAIHSAIVNSVYGTSLSQIEVVSKWGRNGLFKHYATDCMYMNIEELPCNRIVVYRLCTHFDANHSCSYNAATHTCICSICGTLGTETHEMTYSSINSSSHYVDCTECNYSTTASHLLVCQSINSTQHSSNCEYCNYSLTSSHSLVYRSVNAIRHTITCEDCEYSKTELHVLNNLNICTLCGAKGTQIEINSFEDEVYIQ